MRLITSLAILLFLGACTAPTTETFWEKKNVTDDFGDPIEGDFYYRAIVPAKANSEDCLASLMKNDDYVSIVFADIETESVHNLPERKFIPLSIKVDDGQPLELELFIFQGMITDTKGQLDSLIQSSNTGVKVLADLARASRSYNTKYIFEIDKISYFSEFPE